MSKDEELSDADYWYNRHSEVCSVLNQYKKALVLIKIHALQQQHIEVVDIVDDFIPKDEFNSILKQVIKE